MNVRHALLDVEIPCEDCRRWFAFEDYESGQCPFHGVTDSLDTCDYIEPKKENK